MKQNPTADFVKSHSIIENMQEILKEKHSAYIHCFTELIEAYENKSIEKTKQKHEQLKKISTAFSSILRINTKTSSVFAEILEQENKGSQPQKSPLRDLAQYLK